MIRQSSRSPEISRHDVAIKNNHLVISSRATQNKETFGCKWTRVVAIIAASIDRGGVSRINKRAPICNNPQKLCTRDKLSHRISMRRRRARAPEPVEMGSPSVWTAPITQRDNRTGDITGYVYETLSRVSNICHVLTGCPIKRFGAAHNCPFSTPRKRRPRPALYLLYLN